MKLITEYKGKKALVLSAFDKENLYWEVIKKQNEYGQDEFIITGDVIDKIAETLQAGYEAQGDVAIWKYRFEQADLCYRYAIQDQMNEEAEKPPTNFDKITSSVESFAKWFVELSKTKSIDCDFTYYYNLGTPRYGKWTEEKQEAIEGTIEWLQKECD